MTDLLLLPESETSPGERDAERKDERSDERERGAETEAGVGHSGQEREGNAHAEIRLWRVF